MKGWDFLSKVDISNLGELLGGAVVAGGIAFLSWKKRRKRHKDLRTHPFFGRLRHILREQARDLPIHDRMRKEAIQDLLSIKFGLWANETERLISRMDVEGLTPIQFREELMDFLDRVIAAYERESEDRGIPHLLVIKFRTWHAPAVTQTKQFLESICDSDWVTDNHARMVSFLFWLLGSLENTLMDAELTLADINGDLNGIAYKGFVAEPWESPKRQRNRACRVD